jgi:hypothetical protein
MTARSLVSLRPRAPSHRRGVTIGTGMPVMDARADFERARRAQIAARSLRWLPSRRTGRARLRALDGTRALPWTANRQRVIPVDAIVGTADATTDFDADFRPTTNRIAARWQRVALAHRRGYPLPPITVIERPDGYYVIDGRHRVSVARAVGQTEIEACVSPTMRTAGRGSSMPPLTSSPRDGDEQLAA